jgi:hypothetical protein
MQWGLLAPATVILGGAGLLFLAGAQEIGQNVGYGWQAGLVAAGGAAVLLLLALLYVLNPADVLPDVIVGVGYLDDATVVAFCLKLIEKELEKYKAWQLVQKPSKDA